eukprot:11188087-Heterocapsa_arctica.AAC.1
MSALLTPRRRMAHLPELTSSRYNVRAARNSSWSEMSVLHALRKADIAPNLAANPPNLNVL